MPTGLTIAIIVGAVMLFMMLKIVPEYERLVVLRLGKVLDEPKGPGIVLLIPVIDKPIWVDLREIVTPIPHQACITKDNASISVDLLIYRKVVDPTASVVQVQDFSAAAGGIAVTTLRAVIGDIALDDVLAKREQINHTLQSKMAQVTSRWGVKITTVEIQEIKPPKDILDAMTRQMSAERTRRALVIEAEGTKAAAITVADGEKQSAILKAEGDRQSRILNAEGERQAAILRAEGEKQATITRAEATQKQLEFQGAGEAAKIEKVGRAEAAKVLAVGEAEAEVIKKKLLAEAEGLQRKAEAWKNFNEAAVINLVVDKMPELAQAFATQLAGIDKINIIEMGNGAGSGGIGKVMNTVGGGMTAMLSMLKDQFGVDIARLMQAKTEAAAEEAEKKRTSAP